MVVMKNFKKYRIAIRSDYWSKQDEYGVKNYITIECYDVDQANPVAELRFYDDLNFRKNVYLADWDRIFLNFHMSRFNDVYNLIRHEKPIFVVIDPQTLDGHVMSQNEPVGQEDIEP